WSFSVFAPCLIVFNVVRMAAFANSVDGRLIGCMDKGSNSGGDAPADIDIMVRRSLDQGDTWENEGVMVNEYPGNAANIDQVLVQDKDTKRIYSLVLAFPEGGGFPTAEQGTGFVTIDGNEYMALYNEDGEEYTVRENGVVFDDNHEATDYTVDKVRNLYLNGEKISNVLLNESPLK